MLQSTVVHEYSHILWTTNKDTTDYNMPWEATSIYNYNPTKNLLLFRVKSPTNLSIVPNIHNTWVYKDKYNGISRKL